MLALHPLITHTHTHTDTRSSSVHRRQAQHQKHSGSTQVYFHPKARRKATPRKLCEGGIYSPPARAQTPQTAELRLPASESSDWHDETQQRGGTHPAKRQRCEEKRTLLLRARGNFSISTVGGAQKVNHSQLGGYQRTQGEHPNIGPLVLRDELSHTKRSPKCTLKCTLKRAKNAGRCRRNSQQRWSAKIKSNARQASKLYKR